MQNIEPSLRALRLVQLVEEAGGLVNAAEQMGLSQSAASHAIAGLERQFGVKLFVRGRGQLRLADTCTRLLPHIRQIFHSLGAIQEEVAADRGVQQSTIRVAAVPSLASSVIPPLMRQFERRCPGVTVNLLEGTDLEVAEWVRSRVCHCGFAALPVTGLQTQPLAEDEWTILAPAGEFAGQVRVGLKAVSRRRFLLSGGGCEEHIRRLFQEEGLNLPDHLLVRQMDTLQAMVAERLGVSVIPSLCLRRRPKNTRVVPLWPRRCRTIGLLLPVGAAPSPALKRWIDLARAEFSVLVKRTIAS